VDHSIGKGSFGRVVKAYDTLGKRYVAIKIVKSKSAFYKQAQVELKILMSLQADADKWNIVTVLDAFMHKNHQCLVFELLSLNLYELLRNTRFTGVSLKLIAKFGQQLLCTLGHLNTKERGDKRVIHCDLKVTDTCSRHRSVWLSMRPCAALWSVVVVRSADAIGLFLACCPPLSPQPRPARKCPPALLEEERDQSHWSVAHHMNKQVGIPVAPMRSMYLCSFLCAWGCLLLFRLWQCVLRDAENVHLHPIPFLPRTRSVVWIAV
jgi:serine/threonine protein kinase